MDSWLLGYSEFALDKNLWRCEPNVAVYTVLGTALSAVRCLKEHILLYSPWKLRAPRQMWDPHFGGIRRLATQRRERKEGVLAGTLVPGELDLAGGTAVLEFSTRWHTTCGSKLI